MYVGDRSGTIFRVQNGRATPFATLPASVAAFHLAMSPDGELFVCAPTLASYDYVYRIDRDGRRAHRPISAWPSAGAGVLAGWMLHVVDALAGASGVYRFADLDAPPELVVSGHALVGWRSARRR